MTFYRKPMAVMRLMNRVFSAFASLGLTPSHMITLETKGRKSGLPRSIVVNSVEYGGQRYLVSPRGETEWVRNVRADGGRATMRHRGRRPVKLMEVPVEERAPILQAYLKANAMSTKAHFGIEPSAPIEEFQREAAKHPVFRIEEGG